MERSLALAKGEIILGEEKITIRDNAKKEKLIRIGSSFMWTVYGILSVLRYMKTGDNFLLWSGLIIGPLHAIVLVYSLFRTAKGEVNLQEIRKATFKRRNGNLFLDLQLKSNLKRRITKVEPIHDELKSFLIDKKIEVR